MSAVELKLKLSPRQFGQVYMWSLVAAGSAIILVSVYEFPFHRLDLRFTLLCLMVVASSAGHWENHSRRYVCFLINASLWRPCRNSDVGTRRCLRDVNIQQATSHYPF